MISDPYVLETVTHMQSIRIRITLYHLYIKVQEQYLKPRVSRASKARVGEVVLAHHVTVDVVRQAVP